MSKYKVVKMKAQAHTNDEYWDRVEFGSGWITCFNENAPDIRTYYPNHEIARIEKWEEELPVPEQRLSWNDLERLS